MSKRKKSVESAVEIQTVAVESFESIPRKSQASIYDPFAERLAKIPDGKGILMAIPKGRDPHRFRNQAYASLRKPLARLGVENPKLSIRIGKDLDYLLISLKGGK